MVCNYLKRLDTGFRRNDGKRYFGTFYEIVKVDYIFHNRKNIGQNQGNFKRFTVSVSKKYHINLDLNLMRDIENKF